MHRHAASWRPVEYAMVKPNLTDELRIELLANNPHLIPIIGQLRYREWGEASTTGFT